MSAHSYKTDFFAWTREQSALIRAGRWIEIDSEHLRENPSLKAALLGFIEDVYPSAIVAAANETGLDDGKFPADCPYSVGQLFDPDYLPE